MILTRWLTSVLGIGCTGPPPIRRKIHIECNHANMYHHDTLVPFLEVSFPGDMVEVSKSEDSSFVGIFHCCFCPPGKQNDNSIPDWFNVTSWENELTHLAQEMWEHIEHCSIVIEPGYS